MSLTAAKKMSMDAAVAVVLLALNDILKLKDEQKRHSKLFLVEKIFFASLQSDWSTLTLLDRRFVQLLYEFWLPCTNVCYELFAGRTREINKAPWSVNSLYDGGGWRLL